MDFNIYRYYSDAERLNVASTLVYRLFNIFNKMSNDQINSLPGNRKWRFKNTLKLVERLLSLDITVENR